MADSRENPSVSGGVSPATAVQVAPPRQNPLMALPPSHLGADERDAWHLVNSGFFKDSRSLSQAVVKLKFGRKLGLDDYSCMTGLFVSNQGKLQMTANLMFTLMKKYSEDGRTKKYRLRLAPGHPTAKECSLHVFERNEQGQYEPLGVETVRIADFQHLVKTGSPWQHYPKNMLFSRCVSNVAKFHAADAFGGSQVYLPDELPGSELEVDGATLEAKSVTVLNSAPAVILDNSPLLASITEELKLQDKDLGWVMAALDYPGELTSLQDLSETQLKRLQILLTTLKQEE